LQGEVQGAIGWQQGAPPVQHFFFFCKTASPWVIDPTVMLAITIDPNPTGRRTGGDAVFDQVVLGSFELVPRRQSTYMPFHLGISHGTLDFLLISHHRRNFVRFERILRAHVLEFIDHNEVAVQLCCCVLNYTALGVGTIQATCRALKSCQDIYRSNEQFCMYRLICSVYNRKRLKLRVHLD